MTLEVRNITYEPMLSYRNLVQVHTWANKRAKLKNFACTSLHITIHQTRFFLKRCGQHNRILNKIKAIWRLWLINDLSLSLVNKHPQLKQVWILSNSVYKKLRKIKGYKNLKACINANMICKLVRRDMFCDGRALFFYMVSINDVST